MAPKSDLKLLAFDLGAESGRAILGKFDGKCIELSDVHRFPNQPVSLPDGLHWDILSLWTEIKRGLVKATQENGKEIASIGLDTWGVDFGLLDKQGVLIGNPYHYRDSRTDGMVERAFTRMPMSEIYSNTGIQFLQLNTLYQLFAMAEQHAPALDIAHTFLTIPDLLNYWLTGRLSNEFTNATTTQCFDTRSKTWAKPVLDRLGIPTHIFGEIIPPGTDLGVLLKGVSDECETGSIHVIAPACHDTGSAVAAVPASSSNFAWISSGTWSIMGVETKSAIVNETSLNLAMTNEGGVGLTSRLSKNIMGLWPVQECRRTWARHGQDLTYDELTTMAGQAPALRSVINVDHNDFLKPGDMPGRIQAYCRNTQQAEPSTPGEIVRCALESVALKYRTTLDALETLLGHPIEVVHIVGGGTRNKLLSQFAADAMNRTVITGPIEATAIGNLLVQSIALGEIDSLESAREVVRNSFEVVRYDPSPDRSCWEDALAKLNKLP
jgi:rhamnulokinase